MVDTGIIALTAPTIVFFGIWLRTILHHTRSLVKNLSERFNKSEAAIVDELKYYLSFDIYLEAFIVGSLNGIIIVNDLKLFRTGMFFIFVSVILFLIGCYFHKRQNVRKFLDLIFPSMIAGQGSFLLFYKTVDSYFGIEVMTLFIFFSALIFFNHLLTPTYAIEYES